MIREPLTILLLEDNADDERLALRALRLCGLPLVVQVARDGVAALAALGLDGSSEGATRLVPDLVISDLKMPRMNGDEVLRRARADARFRDVPYVVFSSSDEAEDVRRCMEWGATAYCVKPVGYDEYLECAGRIARRWLMPEEGLPKPVCVAEAPPESIASRCGVL